MGFRKLGLADHVVRGTDAAGYTTPTPIQSLAIPAALAGKDVIGCSQTGTGKTAAFVLPILHRLATHPGEPNVHRIRALILTPTRELCVQVEESIEEYGKFMNVRSLAAYGGVSIEPQIDALHKGLDLLVATPGRLLDLLQRWATDLRFVEVLVVDEADRMFDMGFIRDVRKIIGEVPKQRQTFLFSATMSKEVLSLVKDIQHDPELIEVGVRNNPVETVDQHFYSIHTHSKMKLLIHLLDTLEMDSVLVFSRTKHGADKIAHQLRRERFVAAPIHSDRTQSERERTLEAFKQGRVHILVATDIAARGIDVEGISHVVNYDTPRFAEDYVHRIGRTGRASATGTAITFVSREEQEFLRKIGRYIGKKIDATTYPGFTQKSNGSPSTHERAGIAPKTEIVAQRSSERPSAHQRRRKPSRGRRRQSGRPTSPATP